MSDDPYKAPEQAPVPEKESSPSARFSLTRVLWALICCLGLILTQAFGFRSRIIGIVMTTLGVAGLKLKWGPTIPGMFVGALVSTFLSHSQYAHNQIEAVYQDLVDPFIGAVIGGFTGFFIDRMQTPSSNGRNSDQEKLR